MRNLEFIRSPLPIFIAFKPGKSGKPPNMSSLTVTVLGFFDIDITDRVVEYIRGNDLDIKDFDGNPNERIIKVNVIE